MVCWKTHQGVLENTSICVRKRTKMRTKTHPIFTHLLLHTFEKHTFLMKTHHGVFWNTTCTSLRNTARCVRKHTLFLVCYEAKV